MTVFIRPVEEQLGSCSEEELLALLTAEDIEVTVPELLWLMNHDSETVRSLAAEKWENRPFSDKVVLIDFISNPNVPENFLFSVLETEFRRRVADAPAITAKVAERILRKGSGFTPGEMNSVGRNRHAPVEALEMMLKKNRSARRAVAGNPNLPVKYFRELMLTESLQEKISQNASLPEEDILYFLEERSEKLSNYSIKNLLIHRNFSSESIRRVYSRKKILNTSLNWLNISLNLPLNENTPADVLAQIPDECLHLMEKSWGEPFLKHPNLNEEAFRAFMRAKKENNIILTAKLKHLSVVAAKKVLPEYKNYPLEWVELAFEGEY